MKDYYELHITLTCPEYNEYRLQSLITEFEGSQKWTFSKIDGDPVLGEGVKCYATTQVNTRVGDFKVGRILEEMRTYLASKIDWYHKHKILRLKIELVMYDQIAGRDFDVEEKEPEVSPEEPPTPPSDNKNPDDDIPF